MGGEVDPSLSPRHVGPPPSMGIIGMVGTFPGSGVSALELRGGISNIPVTQKV